jgi:hypothetical protein
VQVPAHIAEPDQVRQRPIARRAQLPGVLAKLGLDPFVAEKCVHVVLVVERMLLSGLDDGDRVLRDGESAAHRVFPHRHVVVLRTGEVLQQVAVALGRHDP